MAEHIRISNFGPIRAAVLEIKSKTIFIGPQGGGKSTTAKLIAIFRNLNFIVGTETFSDLLKHYNISNYWRKNATIIRYTHSDYSVLVADGKATVEQSPSFVKKLNSEKDRVRAIFENVVNKHPDQTFEEREAFINRLYQTNFQAFFEGWREQFYIPAERILTSVISNAGFSFNQVSLPGCLAEFGRQFERSRTAISELKIAALNVTYKFDEANAEPRIYHSQKSYLPLSESSSGVQALVPMQLVFDFETNGLSEDLNFIVEEPELNLFPSAQREIVHYLIAKCNTKHDLIITTHSPYVLSVLNNLVFASIVAKKGPEQMEAVEKTVSEKYWIDPDNFSAYFFENGEARSILDEKTRLISDNELDSVSGDISDEREALLELLN